MKKIRGSILASFGGVVFVFIFFMTVHGLPLNNIGLQCKEKTINPHYGCRGIRVTVTTYNATEEQCDDTPDITSIGAKITPGVRWVAVSQDLLNFNLNYRDSVYLEVYHPPGSTRKGEKYSGWYKVMDRTSARLRKTVDILITDGSWGGKWNGTITEIK